MGKGLPPELQKKVNRVIIRIQVESLVKHESSFPAVLAAVQKFPLDSRQLVLEEMVGVWSREKQNNQKSQRALNEWMRAQPDGATKDRLTDMLFNWGGGTMSNSYLRIVVGRRPRLKPIEEC